ncbi:hypothetical protein QR556_06215 [Acinetobacter soli]|uniref:hypothetical protein n=1 Tax=Acinetobacter soli TaxID=487316 RepID=UPI002D7F0671|nr:hypothetical protein [Acinetobacter soli]MEB4800562.1 hypothetical protein [Acinetobacter soli]
MKQTSLEDPAKEPTLEDLIQLHLDNKLYNDEDVVKKTASLFIFFKESFISKTSGETFYKLPYKEISRLIFGRENVSTLSETFQSFSETVYEKMVELNNGEDDAHIKECYEKFTHHISLAIIQKEFIQRAANAANITAAEAKHNSDTAKEEAIKAKKTYDEMMVNYITILGIFASIIITIFGGMQVISATTGLLQSNISIATLLLVLSFLALLIILILSILLNWISNLKDSIRSYSFIYAALIVTSVTIIGSASYLYAHKKDGSIQKDAKVLLKEKKD